MQKFIFGILFCLFTSSILAYPSFSYYGPTSGNENLYRIATRVSPSPELSPQQVMVAILLANPSAFNQNNVNGLKSGYKLRIPPLEAIARISPEYAINSVNHQNMLWSRAYNDQAKSATKIAKRKQNKQFASNAKDLNSVSETSSKDEKISKHSTALNESDDTKTTLIDLVNQQKASQKGGANETATNATDTPVNTSTTSQAAVPTIDPKVQSFMEDSQNFQQQANTQLISLTEQNKALATKVAQLNEELKTLTYQVIQLTAKDNQKLNYKEAILAGIKHNILGLSAGLLSFILLTYLLVRSFRPRRVIAKDNKRDEYDFMSSKESIPSKFDLARAYMDMGDNASAESVLKEVVLKGNEEQKRRAKDLLGKMNVGQ